MRLLAEGWVKMSRRRGSPVALSPDASPQSPQHRGSPTGRRSRFRTYPAFASRSSQQLHSLDRLGTVSGRLTPADMGMADPFASPLNGRRAQPDARVLSSSGPVWPASWTGTSLPRGLTPITRPMSKSSQRKLQDDSEDGDTFPTGLSRRGIDEARSMLLTPYSAELHNRFIRPAGPPALLSPGSKHSSPYGKSKSPSRKQSSPVAKPSTPSPKAKDIVRQSKQYLYSNEGYSGTSVQLPAPFLVNEWARGQSKKKRPTTRGESYRQIASALQDRAYYQQSAAITDALEGEDYVIKMDRDTRRKNEEAALQVQRVYRGFYVRREILAQQLAAAKIQQVYLQRQGDHERKRSDVAAVQIQRIARGRLARSMLKKRRELKEQAKARSIQRIVRGRQIRTRNTSEFIRRLLLQQADEAVERMEKKQSLLDTLDTTPAKKPSGRFRRLSVQIFGMESTSSTSSTSSTLPDMGTQDSARKVFDMLDTDGGGTLGRSEVAALAKMSNGGSMTTEEVAAALDAMDADGEGEVTFDEFWAWWQVITTKAPTPTHTPQLAS